jgi:adenylate kinase family enzyme
MLPIFLLVGAPASGKSTVSHALAEKYPKSIHIRVDDVRSMVVSGLTHPSLEWSPALIEQLELVRQCVTTMALTYHRANFVVVVDDFWDPNSQMREYATLFECQHLKRILLYPTQEQAQARNRGRLEPGEFRDYLDEGIREVYRSLNTVVNKLRENNWHILDTTNDTVEATVAKLMAMTSL